MEYKKIINGKKILVTGGTGSLGSEIIKFLRDYSPKKIIILSRDENKQYQMQKLLSANKNISFELGDIRDYQRMLEVTKNVDILLHAAALKHVPPGEKEPMEFIKTNVLGAKNIIDASISNKVAVVIGIGTDKLIKATNVYGMTKALQEKLMISANEKTPSTKFVCVRYGNVVGSRGSVIPFFKEKILKNEPLPVTDPTMTRFLLKLQGGVELIFHAIKEGKGGEVFVKKMPAAKIIDLAKAMGEGISGNKDYPIKIVGIRPGEKIHEILVSEEELKRSIELKDNYIIYNYGKIRESRLINKNIKEYDSSNTQQLSKQDIIKLLKEDGWI